MAPPPPAPNDGNKQRPLFGGSSSSGNSSQKSNELSDDNHQELFGQDFDLNRQQQQNDDDDEALHLYSGSGGQDEDLDSQQVDDLFNDSDSQLAANGFVYDAKDGGDDEEVAVGGEEDELGQTFDTDLLDETQAMSNCTEQQEELLIEEMLERGLEEAAPMRRKATDQMLSKLKHSRSNAPDHRFSNFSVDSNNRDSDILSNISKYDYETNRNGLAGDKKNYGSAFGNMGYQVDYGDDAIGGDLENLEDTKGHSVKEWVTMAAPGREIRKRFHKFLSTFTLQKPKDNDDRPTYPFYSEAIKKMIRQNACSIEIDYNWLANSEHVLAFFLPEAPKEILDIFTEVLTRYVLGLYPNYSRIQKKIIARVSNLPLIEEIHLLRQLHLNQLVRVPGVVSSQTPLLPQLDLVKYNCIKCGALIGPFSIEPSTNIVSQKETKPNSCVECYSSGPFAVNSKETLYRNYQCVKMQESPQSVPAGRLPRSKIVILTDDLVDCCRPGDEIEVTGVFKNNFDTALNTKNGFPVFATVIEANHLLVKTNKSTVQNRISNEELQRIKELSSLPNIVQCITQSIAPSIYGKEDIKLALAVALFGGEAKNIADKHLIRGDINVLLCGDPGTAKSQFLRFVAQVAPRAVMTTGQGASAVGLTASVIRSSGTSGGGGRGEFSLEAGALVLADRGVCLIDEFDKMNDRDRTSIHEAMEQQTISISKAGIVATLKARCSVIAASNPISGRYNPALTFMDNVDLTEPILSRFDILCVVKDNQDIFEDERLAEFVCESHMKSHPDRTTNAEHSETGINKQQSVNSPFLEPSFLQKYVAYAKENCHPKMSPGGREQISQLYAILRRESQVTNSIPVTVRHIESIIRISEAFARMHLRNHVIDSDIKGAIRIAVNSFIETQKYSVTTAMKVTLKKYLEFGQDRSSLMLFILKKLFNDKFIYNQNLVRKTGGTCNDETNKENSGESLAATNGGHVISIPLTEIQSHLLSSIKDQTDEQVQYFLNSKMLKLNKFELDSSKQNLNYTIC